MKLYMVSETPVRGSVQVYKQSVISAFIGLLIVGGGTVAMAVAIVRGVLPALLWIAVAFIGLISLLFLGMLRAAMGPDNWVLKFDGSELAFKFRSYLNRHFPAEDRVVVVLPASAIESVRKSVEKIDVPGSDGRRSQTTTETWESLDFRMKDETAAVELDAAIREEIAREAPKIGRSRTKHHHAPMRVVDGRTLRVYWRSPRDHVRPGIETALRNLGGAMRVEGEQATRAPKWEERAPEERDAFILELAQRGNRMKAVKLAREVHGLGLAEAKQYVDARLRDAGASAGVERG